MQRFRYYLFMAQLVAVFCDEPCDDVMCGEVHSVGLLQTDLHAQRVKIPRLAAHGQQHGESFHVGGAVWNLGVQDKPDGGLDAQTIVKHTFIFLVGFLHMCWACHREFFSGKSAGNVESEAPGAESTLPHAIANAHLAETQVAMPTAVRSVLPGTQEVQCVIRHPKRAAFPVKASRGPDEFLWSFFASLDSEAPAFVDAGGLLPSLTFRDFKKLVENQAEVLKQIAGSGPAVPGRLAIVLDQGPSALLCMLSSFAAQFELVVPLDPKLTHQELVRSFADPKLGLTAVVTTDQVSSSTARAAAEEVGLLVIAAKSEGWKSTFKVDKAGRVTSPSGAEVGSHVPVLCLSTSGTTGNPKWVQQPADHILRGAALIAGSLELTHMDQELSVMPLHHIGGISTGLASLVSGGALLYAEGFNPQSMCNYMSGSGSAAHSPSWYYAAPTIHHQVLDAVSKAKPKHRLRLVRSGAAALPPALNERLSQALGCHVLATCSMTECMPVCATLPGQLLPMTSVGPPIGPSLRIADANGQSAPPGLLGEVFIRQDGLVTRGYLGEPLNQTFTEEGWLRTGDLGRLDQEGNLELTGRSKEVINRAGETLSPTEVENALLQVPGVADAMAFAVPSEELGDAVGAAIIFSGSRLALAEIWRSLEGAVVRQLWPDVVVYMSDIPKGKTGKKQRILFARAFSEKVGTSLTLASYEAKASAGLELSAMHFEAVETGFNAAQDIATPGEEDGEHAEDEELSDEHLRLRRIWCHALGMPDKGGLDWSASLWSLGGNSALLSSIVAQIRAEFKLRPEQMTLTMAMAQPTLKFLAQCLDATHGQSAAQVCMSGTVEEAHRICVPLGAAMELGTTAKDTVVLISAGRQTTAAALHLGASRLGPLALLLPHVRCFGIERPGRGTWKETPLEEWPPELATELVKKQAEACVKVLGEKRSVVLMGTSTGGVWAYCLGLQLQRMGYSLDRLLLADSACPLDDPEPHRKQADQIADFFATGPSEEQIRRFHDKINIGTYGKFSDDQSGVEKGWQEQLLKFWVWDNNSYCALMEQHAAQPGAMPAQLSCPIAVFNATEETHFFRRSHDKSQWMQFTSTGPFEIIDMPTNHDGLLKHLTHKLHVQDPDITGTMHRLLLPEPASERAHGMCCPWQNLACQASARLGVIDETENELTCGQIMASAQGLALTFRAEGLEPGERVMVIGEVSAACLIAQLALLHCGAVSVLIGVGETSEYLAQVAETADCRHLLILAGDVQVDDIPYSLTALSPTALPCCGSASEVASTAAFVERAAPASILFSSGSTGKPKGVVQSYGTLLALSADVPRTKEPTVWKGSIGWIANYVLPHALAGQTLMVVPKHVQLHPPLFQGLRRRHGVQTLTMAPSELRAQLTSQDCLNDLQSITCIAEALPSALAMQFFGQYPDVKLMETYASSEVQGSNAFLSTEVSRDGQTGRFDIRPGQVVFLVDLDNPSKKINVAQKSGELLLQPTAMGYLDAAQTARRFIPNPFGPGKLFRTGDVCVWTSVGKQLKLCGRVDFQVKVSGKLVELEHVERAAEALPGVSLSAARTFVRSSGTMVVVLYVSGQEATQRHAGREGEAQMKELLRKSLPAHAVPAKIIFLEEIPLLKNGKKDRKSLPDPEDEEEETDSIGMVRAVGSRQAQENKARESIYGLVAVSVLVRHLGRLSDFDQDWGLLKHMTSSLDLKVIWMPVGYMDGRSPIVGSDLWLRIGILLGFYIGMGVATTPHAFHGMLLQRWSCLNYAGNLLVHRFLTRFRLPLWAGVLLCYAGAFRIEDWSPSGKIDAPAVCLTETLRNVALSVVVPCDMLVGAGSHTLWGNMAKGCGTYLMWIQIAKSVPDGVVRKVLGRNPALGVLSAVAWYWLTIPNSSQAIDAVLEESGGSIAAMLRAFTIEIAREWCVMLTLVLVVGQGNFLLQLLGKNMVGSYLTHTWLIKPELMRIISILQPEGLFVQTAAVLSTAAFYVLSVGAIVQTMLVRLLRRLQQRSPKDAT